MDDNDAPARRTRAQAQSKPGVQLMSVTITGAGIPLYRLLAVRKMVELEAKGLKFRGGSVTAKMKRELGVKGNRHAVLQAIEAAIAANVASDATRAATLQPGDIVSDIRARLEVAKPALDYAKAVRERDAAARCQCEHCPHCDVENAAEYIR